VRDQQQVHARVQRLDHGRTDVVLIDRAHHRIVGDHDTLVVQFVYSISVQTVLSSPGNRAKRPPLLPGQRPLTFSGPFDQPLGQAIDNSLVEAFCLSARARVIRFVGKLLCH
jgi:hypothetical protein